MQEAPDIFCERLAGIQFDERRLDEDRVDRLEQSPGTFQRRQLSALDVDLEQHRRNQVRGVQNVVEPADGHGNRRSLFCPRKRDALAVPDGQ